MDPPATTTSATCTHALCGIDAETARRTFVGRETVPLTIAPDAVPRRQPARSGSRVLPTMYPACPAVGNVAAFTHTVALNDPVKSSFAADDGNIPTCAQPSL